MQQDTMAQLIGLLTEAGEAHHHYETEVLKQPDADWASWYAEYLVDHRIGQALGRDVSTERLAQLLTKYANAYQAEQPAQSWQEYYASRLTGLSPD